MMNTKLLRQKVLDLAIHGKLVPQCPDDEPASVLLKRIQDEKAALVKAGKLKKKDLETTPVSDEDKPFDVPEGWEWCRLGEICEFLSRGKSPQYSEEPNQYPVYAQKCNLKDGGISLEQARFLNPETVSKWQEEYHLRTGDVLVNSTGTGTVCRTRLFEESVLGSYPFTVPDSHVSVIRTFKDIDSYFCYYIFNSMIIQSYWEDNLAGSTNQKELYIGTIQNTPVPLPPLAEQQRIVAAVEQWMSLIDVIESGEKNLQQSIALAKNKILDLAIRGKLVPKEGEWEKPTLGDLCVFMRNGASIRQEKSAGGLPITRIETISNGVVDREKMGYANITDDQYEKYYLQNGDILMSHINSPIHVGKSALYKSKGGEKIIHGMNLLCIRLIENADPSFMAYYFRSDQFKDQIRPFVKNAVNQASINTRNLSSISIPLPPLSEQHRIVSKIDALFAQLDEIEKSLN